MQSATGKTLPVKRHTKMRRFKKEYQLYLMILPAFLFLLIFSYYPMHGIVIAFQKFLPAKGIWGSKWIGLTNFQQLLNMPGFWRAFRNTLVIAVWKIAMGILVPVVFTLMMNELRSTFQKRLVQTFIYLPHFVSWVLLAGIFHKLLSVNGIVNRLITSTGGKAILFMADKKWFRFTLILTDVWKNFGYGTIVYLAAITNVNPELYEAATIDGCGHWKQMIHVTLPAILPTIMLMTCLSVGNILDGGFDQVYNMYNKMVYDTADIIDTLVYRLGFESSKYGLSTAASLFKSVIAMILVSVSYKAAYKLSGYQVF